jgi:Tfp pilus assembly protein PilF
MKAWAGYLEGVQSGFLKNGQRHAALLVAIKAARIRKDPLSEKLFAQALKDLSAEKNPQAALLAMGYFIEQKQFAEAEAMIAPLLKAEGWSKRPSIWRKASEIARDLKLEALSVARWERALDLEYAVLPDLINLQKIRDDYQALLSRMESLAAMEDREPDLKSRAIRLADRWRAVDPDDTQAARAAGRIMAKLGDKALAWDYFTTPLADKPNESAPWLALAQEMANQQNVEWADRAYRHAFKAESTNAEILWTHAEFLRQHDRAEDAKELLEQIVSGTWQPRFDGIKTQAQQQLSNSTPATTPDTPK